MKGNIVFETINKDGRWCILQVYLIISPMADGKAKIEKNSKWELRVLRGIGMAFFVKLIGGDGICGVLKLNVIDFQ